MLTHGGSRLRAGLRAFPDRTEPRAATTTTSFAIDSAALGLSVKKFTQWGDGCHLGHGRHAHSKSRSRVDPRSCVPHIVAGCARTTASLTTVPQPGPVGSRRSPFSIT